MKFHINSKMLVEPCQATKKPCPFGSAKMHFTGKEVAQRTADRWAELRERYNIQSYSVEEYIDKLTADIQNNPASDINRTKRAELKSLVNGGTTRTFNQQDLFQSVADPDGGASFNPFTNKAPATGFMASPYPEYSKMFNNYQEFLDRQDIFQAYIDEYKDLLQQQGHYIGFWNDPTDGKIYLDISVNYTNASSCRKLCQERDQIAFFDLQDFTSVTVDNNATSGQS